MSGLVKSKCRSCREPIYWVATDSGKRMPIDVEPTETGNLLLAVAESPPRVSVVSQSGRLAGSLFYVSHFSTCRFARQHRRPPAPPRPAAPREAPQASLFSAAGR